MLAGVVEILLLTRKPVECRGCPEKLIAGATVAVASCGDGRLFQPLLTVERRGIGLGPLVGALSHGGCLCRETGVVLLERFQKPGGIGHDGGEVECGGDGLLYDVACLLTLCGHDESLEVGRGQLVVDASVEGVLHGQEPTEVEHHLVEQVGGLVAALGDGGVQAGKVVGELLVDGEHQSDAEC